jgi:thiol:disulfide interchange protein
MKSLLMILGLLLSCSFSRAQILEPAKWIYYTDKEEVELGEEVDLFMGAALEEGWQLYAPGMDPALGPVPAHFSFEPHSSYRLIGRLESIGARQSFDTLWQGEVQYFEGRALFRQRIRILGKNPQIRGTHTYQLCSKKDGRCIMGEEAFSFTGLKVIPQGGKQLEKEAYPPSNAGGDAREERAGQIAAVDICTGHPAAVDTGAGHPAAADTGAVQTPALDLSQGDTLMAVGRTEVGAGQQAGEQGSTAPQHNREQSGRAGAGAAGTSLWQFALLAFGAGLTALLTPCVFPIIPLTVTYFSFGGDRGKMMSTPSSSLGAAQKALLYGLSVVLIYTLIGTFMAWLNGPAFANFLSTHWAPNLFFFAIFMLFALSFLGMFDIRLPHAWVNGVDRLSDKGGYIGVFFMAFTLVLVSFSCTGPIVGTLLVASAGGAVLLPIVGMASFALAIALPFTLLALFPQGLKKLPHSGSWLNRVKGVLGFLELALGLKFLSVADQVYGWGLLDRPVYLALWITIFSAMGAYLLGWLELPNDGTSGSRASNQLGVPRLLLALGVFSFVVYLLPGMFGAPLAPLAGYLPPPQQEAAAGMAMPGTADNSLAPAGEGLCDTPLWGDRLHWPHGLQGYFDLEQALACAREQNKPLFIAFTGHGCVNCREMEARVWSDRRVLERLRRDYVLLALYVDDKMELPPEKWYRSSFDGRLKKSVGMQNGDFQIRRFGTNAQPYYAVLDPESREPLLAPMAYDLEVSHFINFLDRGKKAYHARQGQALLPVGQDLSRKPAAPGPIL